MLTSFSEKRWVVIFSSSYHIRELLVLTLKNSITCSYQRTFFRFWADPRRSSQIKSLRRDRGTSSSLATPATALAATTARGLNKNISLRATEQRLSTSKEYIIYNELLRKFLLNIASKQAWNQLAWRHRTPEINFLTVLCTQTFLVLLLLFGKCITFCLYCMLLYNIAKSLFLILVAPGSNRPTGQYYLSFYGLLSEDPSELSFKIVSPLQIARNFTP